MSAQNLTNLGWKFIYITYLNHSFIVQFSDPQKESLDDNNLFWFDIRVDLVNGCCQYFLWCKCVIYIKSACSQTLICKRSGHKDFTIGMWSEEKYLIYALDTVHRFAEMTSRFIERVKITMICFTVESICDIFDILFKEIGQVIK